MRRRAPSCRPPSLPLSKDGAGAPLPLSLSLLSHRVRQTHVRHALAVVRDAGGPLGLVVRDGAGRGHFFCDVNFEVKVRALPDLRPSALGQWSLSVFLSFLMGTGRASEEGVAAPTLHKVALRRLEGHAPQHRHYSRDGRHTPVVPSSHSIFHLSLGGWHMRGRAFSLSPRTHGAGQGKQRNARGNTYIHTQGDSSREREGKRRV